MNSSVEYDSALDDTLKALDALQEILRVMNETPGDLAVIFDIILENVDLHAGLTHFWKYLQLIVEPPESFGRLGSVSI